MATSGPRSATSASAWKDALVPYRPRLARAYPPRWDGTSPDGAPIAFEPRAVGPDRVGLDVALAVATGAPGLVVMARAQALTDAGGFATGDAEFDAEVVVLAGDAHAGLFDAMARRRLRALVALGGWVADDSLHLDAAASLAVGPDGLAAVVDAMDRVARDLEGAHDSASRVLRIALDDPNPAVRTRYRALSRAPDLHSARAERAIAAAGDDDDGFAVLATHLADHSLPDSLRLAAAERLVAGFPLARLADLGVAWRRLAVSGDFGPSAARLDAPGAAEAALRLAEFIADGALDGAPASFVVPALELWRRTDMTRESLERVLTLVRHPSPAVASRAAYAYLERAPLEQALQHEATLSAAAGASFEVLSRLAIERVMAALRAPALTPTTRDTALALLEKRVPRSWLDATRVLELLPHLARGPSERALALFGELVAHPSDAVRRAAWEHLMRLDAPLEAVLAALGRPAEVVRAVAPLRPERSAQGGAVVLSLIDHVDARRFPSIVVGYLGLLTALGTSAHAEAIGAFLESYDDRIVAAALDALAAIGTPAQLTRIEPLSKGIFRDAETKARARAALDAIAARDGDPSGGLTLSEHHARGAVSLADDEPAGGGPSDGQ